MQNSQYQGPWGKQGADLRAPGGGNGECPGEEPNGSSGLGGLESCPRGKGQCFRSADLNSALSVGSWL